MAPLKIVREAVEINIAQHCNLRCSHCDHVSPLLPEKLISREVFESDLMALSRVIELEELRFVGGEPLLHPELIDLFRIARTIGVARKLILVTNGLLLDRAPAELWKNIDRLWISRYPGVVLRMSEDRIAALAKEAGVDLWIKESPEFRLTLLNQPIADLDKTREIFRTCELSHVWSCHVVHEGRYYKCSPAPLLRQRLSLLGRDLDNRERDGVALHDNPRLRDDLVLYLASPDPLAACSWCLGSRGPHVAVKQLNRAALRAALAEDHSAAADHVHLRVTSGDRIEPSRPPLPPPPWWAARAAARERVD